MQKIKMLGDGYFSYPLIAENMNEDEFLLMNLSAAFPGKRQIAER